jgi:hypothetical protein
MSYTVDVVVTEIKADFAPPTSAEFVQVSFGYRLPVPMPPQQPGQIQMGAPVLYKHAMHLFIPKQNCLSQFTMWENCTITVSDEGEVQVKKKVD